MRFRFDGGDGDQNWFGESFLAEQVKVPWFPPTIADEPAYLLKVLTGHHRGEFIAITSRVVASLEEQLRVRDFISVVVHIVLDPGPGFRADGEHLTSIGMAAIEAIKLKGPAIFNISR